MRTHLIEAVVRMKAQAERPQTLRVGGNYVPQLCEQLKELNARRKPGWKSQTIEGSHLFGLRIEVVPYSTFEVR